MRVLAHLPLYPPSSLVGAWLSTHECLAALARRGHDVEVSTYLSSGPKWQYDYDGVAVFPRRPLDLAGFDLVVSHLGDKGEASRAAQAHGVPSVRMVHGVPTVDQRLIDNDMAVFNSRSLADLVGWGGRQMVLAPPIWQSEYRTAPGDMVTLVNLTPDKGGYHLWKIADRMPHVQFLAVRGGYGPQVVRWAPNVEVIDPTVDVVRDVYGRTRILLMPSRVETYGRAALEAACSGIPTIAHPTGGLVESLDGAASFVDRSAVGSWATEIDRLMGAEAWEAASSAARARAARLTPAEDLERFCDEVETLRVAA